MPLDFVYGLIFTGLFVCLTPLLGKYMAKVFTGKVAFADGIANLCYVMGGVDPSKKMTWTQYGKALLLFNLLGFVFLFALQLLQGYLPLNPQGLSAVSWHTALNTAISFVTNTNWQSYSGETTLSYLTQMVGLTSQNFLSAATGMGALLVLVRGLIEKEERSVGNFWVDLVRMIVYLLLPLSIILALGLAGEGVIQTFAPYQEITTLENGKQIIPLGPVASQIAIKQLGTNGGGFFNANSAHPFENPTSFSNLLEMLAIILIPSSTFYTYGIMINSKRHAWMLFSICLLFWAAGTFFAFVFEYSTPILEGLETRFGIPFSTYWTTLTTTAANGSTNAALSSLSAMSGGIAMFNMILGVIFGGIGVGMSGMIMMVLLTVFLSGLMVGRTPEYLGKKIEKKEMQWVVISLLFPGAVALIGAGLSSALTVGTKGPHGLSEILYAFISTSANNGSAFAGLNANTPYYNIILSLMMLFGRTSLILPSLAIGGLLADKKITPSSIGTFSTNSVLFMVLLICIIFIVGALTFFPALSLGPIIEQFLMSQGKVF